MSDKDKTGLELKIPCTNGDSVETSETARIYPRSSLQWNADSCLENLCEDLDKFMVEDSQQDVEFKCGDQIVRGHRNFLGKRSPVLAAMLKSDMAEGRTGVVEIRDMEPGLFQLFIRYLYTGKLPPLTIDTARRFYEAGDKYQVEGVTRRCADFLKQNLSPANACDLLVLADAHSDHSLKEDVFAYILDNKIPLQDDIYLAFCDNHPRLSHEVLYRFYKLQSEIQQSGKK